MIAAPAGHEAVVPVLEAALSSHDEGTGHHSVRVARLADAVADRLLLSSDSRKALWWAASLHDVGKLAVSPDIIAKPGPLTAEEWEQIRRHPSIGAGILLAASPRLRTVAEGVRSHHERWDGGGYPDRLGGERIPLSGRIICVADVYDSVTSPRPYRPECLAPTEAAELIERESGRAFDPNIAAVFTALVRENVPISKGEHCRLMASGA